MAVRSLACVTITVRVSFSGFHCHLGYAVLSLHVVSTGKAWHKTPIPANPPSLMLKCQTLSNAFFIIDEVVVEISIALWMEDAALDNLFYCAFLLLDPLQLGGLLGFWFCIFSMGFY